MLTRLYVHNLRCLENFELAPGGLSSILLLGRNGSGKTTVAHAFEILQKIARGTNRVGELVKPKDLAHGRTHAPVRIEIEAIIKNRAFLYSVAFELPTEFRELRVFEEELTVDGSSIYSREIAQVRLARTGLDTEATFRIDWHLVALPIVQERNANDPIYIFRQWLANAVVLKPIPSLIRGDSDINTLGSGRPDKYATNLGAWFSALNAVTPSVYSQVSAYLEQVMPDFKKITNPPMGRETRSLIFHFQNGAQDAEFFLEDLSDGEKCFFLYALVIAANSVSGPILCFWDEPDNFLAPEEVGHAVMALRRAFRDCGQIIVTSHNPEAMRRFSEENTFQLFRESHLDPTTIVSVEELRATGRFEGGFVDALIRGDVAP